MKEKPMRRTRGYAMTVPRRLGVVIRPRALADSDTTSRVNAILDDIGKRMERVDSMLRPLESRRDLVLRNIGARRVL